MATKRELRRWELIEQVIRYHLGCNDFTPHALDDSLSQLTGKMSLWKRVEQNRLMANQPKLFDKERS